MAVSPISEVEPDFRLATYDTVGTPLDDMTTPISVVPDELDDNDALLGLLDAARRYYERHPGLASIEIEMVREGIK